MSGENNNLKTQEILLNSLHQNVGHLNIIDKYSTTFNEGIISYSVVANVVARDERHNNRSD